MKKVAVVLSGCGVFDGAEIHESVLTLLAIKREGADYQCFAPDIDQMHVINHLTGEVSEGERRNVLVESARIARGEIKPLTALNADNFDALILPGGFGAAKNLCDFAIKGSDCQIHPLVVQVCREFAHRGKAAGYACIAPALMASVYGDGVQLTIGNDADTAAALQQMGAVHRDCDVNDVIIDAANKVVSTPAYMLADNIVDAAEGLQRMVSEVLALS